MRIIGFLGPWYHHHVAPPLLFQLLGDAEQIQSAPGYRLVVATLDITGIDLARNKAIEWALAEHLDYLVMQDADTFALGPWILGAVRVLEAEQAAIAILPVMIERENSPVNVTPAPTSDDPYEAESGGTGLIAIRMAEIARIAAEYEGPWFERTYHDARHAHVKDTGDIWFCHRVREHGGRVMVLPGMETAHDALVQQRYIPPSRRPDEGR